MKLLGAGGGKLDNPTDAEFVVGAGHACGELAGGETGAGGSACGAFGHTCPHVGQFLSGATTL